MPHFEAFKICYYFRKGVDKKSWCRHRECKRGDPANNLSGFRVKSIRFSTGLLRRKLLAMTVIRLFRVIFRCLYAYGAHNARPRNATKRGQNDGTRAKRCRGGGNASSLTLQRTQRRNHPVTRTIRRYPVLIWVLACHPSKEGNDNTPEICAIPLLGGVARSTASTSDGVVFLVFVVALNCILIYL